MSAVQGILTLANAQTSDLVGEFQESIFVRNSKGYNSGSTLFGLMSRLKNEQAENIEFNWWERNPVRRTLYSTAATSAAATTMSFDDNASTPDTSVWKVLVNGHILRNDRTGEYVRVNGTPSTATVTVVRAVGSVAAAAINDNDVWTIVTLAKAEGADPVAASYEEPELVKNYIQTFQSTVELTNAFKGSVLRTDQDGPLKDRRIQALEKISRDIEFAYLLGLKKAPADSGAQASTYSTGGLADSLRVAGLEGALGSGYNSVDANTTIGMANFRDWLNSFMVVGSDQKLAFCGPKAYQAITLYANSATNGFRIMQNESVFGMNITSIMTPFGVLDLTMHPLLREAVALNDWMFVFDLAHIVQKVFEPLFLEPNIQTPGNDSYKEQYRAKLGLKLRFINAHGVIKNLQAIDNS